jgi:hypothetical protein
MVEGIFSRLFIRRQEYDSSNPAQEFHDNVSYYTLEYDQLSHLIPGLVIAFFCSLTPVRFSSTVVAS